MSKELKKLIECYSCGLFVKKDKARRGKTRCPRCHSKLLIEKKHSLDSLYYAISALLLFVLLNVYPFLSLSLNNHILKASLFDTVIILLKQDLFFVAMIVFFTVIIAPLASCLIIILSFYQIHSHKKIFSNTFLHDAFFFFKKWGFIDVFIISIIVTYIKLIGMASSTVFDLGFYIMLLYIFCFYMSTVRFEGKNVFGV